MNTVVQINTLDLVMATLIFGATVSLCFVILFMGMDSLQARIERNRERKNKERAEEEELRRELRERREATGKSSRSSKRRADILPEDDGPELSERSEKEYRGK